MGGAAPTPSVGLLYTGDFKSERIYTVVSGLGPPHVCEKEKSSKKRIIAVFEKLGDAEAFMTYKAKEH